MKVLLSAFHCIPGLGSEPGAGWNWATSLADCGHQMTVLTSSCNKEAILAAGRDDIDFRFVDESTSPLVRFSPQFGLLDIYLRWQDAALKYAASLRQHYDLAHHVTWGSLHLGSRLWRLPVPFVYGPIGGGQTAPASYWRYFGREWPVETFRTASTGSLLKLNNRSRQTIRNAAVTLVCNSATGAACRRLGAADVRFLMADGLPGGWLASARQRPAGPPVVFWAGRLIPRKAPVLAVQAFAELRRAMPARLIIAGDGPLRGKVHAAIERLGLAGDVELVGRVSVDEVRQQYDCASVLLFTSLRESFGAPLLEALGRGLPTVALNHQGIAEVDFGNAAVKVALTPRPRDLPGRLAAALRTVLCDDQWESRSAAGIDWAAEWVWPAKAAAVSRIYQEITGTRAGAAHLPDGPAPARTGPAGAGR